MQKPTFTWLTVVAILAIFEVACAPKPSSSSPPLPVITPAMLPSPSGVTHPASTSEDANWAKVVAEAKKEGKVIVYAAGYTGEIGIQMAKAFEARYNVNLDIVTGRGAEFTERMKTERRLGQMVGDVIQSSSTFLMTMKSLGLTDAVADLPSLRSKGDFHVDPLLDKEGNILIHGFQLIGPMVNTKLVKAGEEPKRWQDVLDPKWKGKMIASDPTLSSGPYITFVPLVNAKAISPDILRQIGKQTPILTRGDQDTSERLSRGDYPMALQVAYTYMATYAKEGAPVKAIPMAEGITRSTLLLSPIKGAPHPNAARLFLDWILSSEGQTVLHKTRATPPLRKDVADFSPQGLILPPDTRFVLETEADVVEGADKYANKWLVDLWKQ